MLIGMSSKRKNWKVIFKGDIEEFDALYSLNYWRDRLPQEKFKEVSSLIEQAISIKGRSYGDASRLLRSTAVLKRF